MVHPKFLWNEYFSGNPQRTLSSVEYESRQNPLDSSVHVLKCLFNEITSGSTGGALCCTSVKFLLVESSSFFSCKTSGSGGAIYFTNNDGQCALYRICGNDCCTTSSSWYQFAYIYVNNVASSKNYVKYSSISRCVNQNSASYTLYLGNGIICCPSVNISMNKCSYQSGIYCIPFTDSSSVTCSLSYSSFADNYALKWICIRFDRGGPNYKMKCCNILGNTRVSGAHGIIYAYGNTVIEDSCILENKATYIFCVNEKI